MKKSILESYKELKHPLANWEDTIKNEKGILMVSITCPHCKENRYDIASQVAYRIRIGEFRGNCYKDRLIGKARIDRALPRPEHPLVDWDITKVVMLKKGYRSILVRVKCKTCEEYRFMQPGPIAAAIRNGYFSGNCINCSPNKKKHNWQHLENGRSISPHSGYVFVSRRNIAPEHIWLYDGTKSAHSKLPEHRMVMAIKLNRPLESHEWVDHIDGNKANNHPDNLRIYIKGKTGMAGNHPGYGLFYHEWQVALSEIEKLKKEILRLKS